MSGSTPGLSLSAAAARLACVSEIADAYLIAAGSVLDLVGRLEVSAAWDRPSALAEWSVGGLASHLAAQVFLGLSRLSDDPGVDPIALDEHYRRAAWVTAEIGDEVSQNIRTGGQRDAADGHDALMTRLREATATLPAVLEAVPSDQPVLIPWQGWSLRRDDFLVTRMMEIAVHSDDLAASVGVSAPGLPDQVLGPVLSLLTRLAVRRHGQSAVLAALTRAERAPAAINAF
jgi:hypothetical protein